MRKRGGTGALRWNRRFPPLLPEGVRWPKNLADFRDKVVCPTFNFSGDHEGAREALDTPLIKARRVVGKNVCHLNAYTAREHAVVAEALRILEDEHKVRRGKLAPHEARMHRALALLYRSIGVYIDGKGAKKLHDPLAAVAAIDPSVCSWEEVVVVQEGKSKWGSVKQSGTGTFAAVDFDPVAFMARFTYNILREDEVRAIMRTCESEVEEAVEEAEGEGSGQ